MIKEITTGHGIQTTEEKLEVLRLKINEIIKYLEEKE